MPPPDDFTWIEKPRLAALSRPAGVEDLQWLRAQGVQLLISLTEERLRRDWVNEAGLLALHVPIEDMEAPTQEQLDRCVSAMNKAIEGGMGVAVHCAGGLGRTGTVLAAYLVSKGQPADNAIARVRRLRPGSVETEEQAEAVAEFARRHQGQQG